MEQLEKPTDAKNVHSGIGLFSFILEYQWSSPSEHCNAKEGWDL